VAPSRQVESDRPKHRIGQDRLSRAGGSGLQNTPNGQGAQPTCSDKLKFMHHTQRQAKTLDISDTSSSA